MIPVKGHPGLYRDENTGAIVNCSKDQFNNYIKLKNAKIKKENEILELKKEIDDLKKIVQQLLNK